MGEGGQGTDCIVVGESSPGYDFGKAALRVIARGRFDPTAQGQTTAGRMVVKKLSFAVGDGAEPNLWNRQPSAREIAAARPGGARDYGMAQIACRTLTEAGAPADCLVQNESPPGQGFGDAALSLAKDFHRTDASLPGLKVGFWINWKAPGSNVLPPGTRIDLSQPGAVPVVEPIVTVFDPAKPGGTVTNKSDVFIASPDQHQIEAARPRGASGDAAVSMVCEVRSEGRWRTARPTHVRRMPSAM